MYWRLWVLFEAPHYVPVRSYQIWMFQSEIKNGEEEKRMAGAEMTVHNKSSPPSCQSNARLIWPRAMTLGGRVG